MSKEVIQTLDSLLKKHTIGKCAEGIIISKKGFSLATEHPEAQCSEVFWESNIGPNGKNEWENRFYYNGRIYINYLQDASPIRDL